MANIVDLDIYRDSHLIVESEPTKPGVFKWTISGEKQNDVDRAITALVKAVDDSSGTAAFGFTGKVTGELRRGWFRAVGFTSDNEEYDAAKLMKEMKRDDKS